MKVRIKTDPESAVLGFKPEMVDTLSVEHLLTLPEASLVVMVESYCILISQGSKPEDAIAAIHEYRSNISSLKSALSPNIFDFVLGRLSVEHKTGMRLTQDFVDTAVKLSGQLFGKELVPPLRSKYTVAKDVIVGGFRLVLASYHVPEGGYLFRWRLMAFKTEDNQFAFSFNLEQTSSTCCLASHSANGSRFNFGSGDPDMSQADFEAWALPVALRKIYGEDALTRDEVTTLGLKLAAEELVQQGMVVLSLDDRNLPSPQIWVVKDGNSAVVFVSVNPTQTFSQLDEADQDELLDTYEAFREQGHETYIGTIAVVRRGARNEYERNALTKDCSKEFAFSGIQRLE